MRRRTSYCHTTFLTTHFLSFADAASVREGFTPEASQQTRLKCVSLALLARMENTPVKRFVLTAIMRLKYAPLV